MRVTIRDIASSLNISHATVSRALNHTKDKYISDSTRSRVISTAREMGYRPNHAAKALATGKTNIVGLWSHYEESGYYTRILHSLLRISREKGYFLTPYDRALDYHNSEENSVSPWFLDAALICDVPEIAETFAKNVLSLPIPCISFGVRTSDLVDSVGIDLYKGAYDAVEYLLKKRSGRVCYLVDEFTLNYSDPRHNAYKDLCKLQDRPQEILPVPEQNRQSARSAFTEYARTQGLPEAIFCHNDEMALGVYKALCDIGNVAVQETLIVGCDGMDEINYLEHPFKSIISPIDEMCALVWKLLERRIQEPTSERMHHMLETRFNS